MRLFVPLSNPVSPSTFIPFFQLESEVVSLDADITRFRGCEMWVVREGYEGLVRGNAEAPPQNPTADVERAGEVSKEVADLGFVQSLRFGDGELFKQGEGDAEDRPDKKTLKGRYIVKVGWDDVRGWMGEVRFLVLLRFWCLLRTNSIGWYAHWNSSMRCIPRR